MALAPATTASTVAILDEAGRPLRPALLWMDSRASAQADRTAQFAAAHPILAWSGGSDAAEWLLPKAIWLKENEPAVYPSAARIVEAIDYLTFRLTGRWVGSQMNAVCKYNYDTINRRFPVELYRGARHRRPQVEAARRDPARRFGRRPAHLSGGRRTRHRRRPAGRGGRHRCPRVAAGLRRVDGRRGLARLGYVVGHHRRGGRTGPDQRGLGPVPAGAASVEVAGRGRPGHQRFGAQVGGGDHHGRGPRGSRVADRRAPRRSSREPTGCAPSTPSWATARPTGTLGCAGRWSV